MEGRRAHDACCQLGVASWNFASSDGADKEVGEAIREARADEEWKKYVEGVRRAERDSATMLTELATLNTKWMNGTFEQLRTRDEKALVKWVRWAHKLEEFAEDE